MIERLIKQYLDSKMVEVYRPSAVRKNGRAKKETSQQLDGKIGEKKRTLERKE